jgi:hypothetical protein
MNSPTRAPGAFAPSGINQGAQGTPGPTPKRACAHQAVNPPQCRRRARNIIGFMQRGSAVGPVGNSYAIKLIDNSSCARSFTPATAYVFRTWTPSRSKRATALKRPLISPGLPAAESSSWVRAAIFSSGGGARRQGEDFLCFPDAAQMVMTKRFEAVVDVLDRRGEFC